MVTMARKGVEVCECKKLSKRVIFALVDLRMWSRLGVQLHTHNGQRKQACHLQVMRRLTKEQWV
jgi:hypothetical protein